MTLPEAIQILKDHNKWRLGAETEPTDPKQFHKTIAQSYRDAIKVLEEAG